MEKVKGDKERESHHHEKGGNLGECIRGSANHDIKH
jgi:hypothetical protein